MLRNVVGRPQLQRWQDDFEPVVVNLEGIEHRAISVLLLRIQSAIGISIIAPLIGKFTIAVPALKVVYGAILDEDS